MGNEMAKCRKRVIKYCKGIGLDLGCGNFKIVSDAIGIDNHPQALGADIHLDLSKEHSLRIFADNSMDYVFSSHLLEDFESTLPILREWCRVVKPGGYLILYLPHGDLYPKAGTPEANPSHKVDLYPDPLVTELLWQNFTIISNEIFNNYKRWIANEYSFQIVAQKKVIYES
jgi:ubiquinone/menaquinone biosynthesis C-methylase UbiE